MDAFDEWLDTRDGATMKRAWSVLAPKIHTVGRPNWFLNQWGVAQLASALHGWPIDRLAWLAVEWGKHADSTITYEHTNRDVACSFIDAAYEQVSCNESFVVREVRDGERGVQLLSVGWSDEWGEKGGGALVARVFDRRRRVAASIRLSTQTVATIGEIDLAPLDLLDHTRTFKAPAWTTHDLANVRALAAQIASEVDAHFDTMSQWTGGKLHEQKLDHPKIDRTDVLHEYSEGAFSIEINEARFPDRGFGNVTFRGLPWGYHLKVGVSSEANGAFGTVEFRLPLALGDRVIARLKAIPEVSVFF